MASNELIDIPKRFVLRRCHLAVNVTERYLERKSGKQEEDPEPGSAGQSRNIDINHRTVLFPVPRYIQSPQCGTFLSVVFRSLILQSPPAGGHPVYIRSPVNVSSLITVGRFNVRLSLPCA